MVEKGKAVTLEVVFAAEAFQNRTSQSEVPTLTPDASVEILPQLWYSSRNTDYERAEDVFVSGRAYDDGQPVAGGCQSGVPIGVCPLGHAGRGNLPGVFFGRGGYHGAKQGFAGGADGG